MATTRRRGAELEQAIYAAVLAELTERGYAGLTFDGVAARARTSRPVLYRRWSTKAEMVLDAVVVLEPPDQDIQLADAGSLAADVSNVMAFIAERFATIGRSTALGLLSELDEDAAHRLVAVAFARGSQLLEPCLERARARGELGPDEIPTHVLALPLDLTRHDIVLRGDLPADRIRDVVEDLVVPAFRAYSHHPDGPGW